MSFLCFILFIPENDLSLIFLQIYLIISWSVPFLPRNAGLSTNIWIFLYVERFEFSNIHLEIFWNFSKIEHVIYTYIFIINNFIYTKIWNILMRWVLYVGWMCSWIESGVIVLSKTSHDFQPQWKSLCDAFNLLLRDGMFHYWSPHSLFTYRNNLSTPLADVPLAGHVTKLTI